MKSQRRFLVLNQEHGFTEESTISEEAIVNLRRMVLLQAVAIGVLVLLQVL